MINKTKTLTTVCPICEAERKVKYGARQEILNVRGEEIEVSARSFYCPEGDHFFSNIEDDEEKFQYAYRVYRERNKILQPEEIKNIRDKYLLSQEGFSIFLGFGKKTIHRYETGAIPDDSHNSFIKLMMDTNNFKFQYEQIKTKLNDRLKQKIEKQIQKLDFVELQLALPLAYASQQEKGKYKYLNTTTVVQGALYSALAQHSSELTKEIMYKLQNELEKNYKKENNSLKELALVA